MMSDSTRPNLTIGRMVARATSRDALGLRLRIESNLAGLDPHPAGLPPGAILCVRRLVDPAPGRYPARAGGTQPSAAWRTALGRRMSELARNATRPALAEVSEGAEAVLFGSQAELLASLACDWLATGSLEHWWWKYLAGDADPAGVVMAQWRHSPAAVPTAMDLLAHRGMLLAFCERILAGTASELAESILLTYGMPDMHAALEQAVRAPAPERQAHPNLETAPWDAIAPELTGARLPAPATLLAGIGLALARQPGLARTQAFASSVGAWLALSYGEPRRDGLAQPDVDPEPLRGVAGMGATQPHEAGEREASAVTRGAPQIGFEAAGVTWTLSDRPAAETRDDADSAPSREGGTTGSAMQALVAGARCPVTGPAAGFGDLKVEPLRQEGEPWWAVVQRRVVVDTEYGGVLFLANVALALGLYPDFTRPGGRGLGLDFWSFLEGAARRLLGRVPVDPVWKLLADLTDDEHGDRCPQVDAEWRMPPAWLEAVPVLAPWRFGVRERRLRVVHEAGFVVLDVPWTVGPEIEAVRRSMSGYPEAPLLPMNAARRWTRQQMTWWDYVMPYIRYRLQLALGTGSARDAGWLLLRQPARIEVCPGSIRASYRLERHPVSIRLAGLDRDPGWIPAAGRTITFRFDQASG